MKPHNSLEKSNSFTGQDCPIFHSRLPNSDKAKLIFYFLSLFFRKATSWVKMRRNEQKRAQPLWNPCREQEGVLLAWHFEKEMTLPFGQDQNNHKTNPPIVLNVGCNSEVTDVRAYWICKVLYVRAS